MELIKEMERYLPIPVYPSKELAQKILAYQRQRIISISRSRRH